MKKSFILVIFVWHHQWRIAAGNIRRSVVAKFSITFARVRKRLMLGISNAMSGSGSGFGCCGPNTSSSVCLLNMLSIKQLYFSSISLHGPCENLCRINQRLLTQTLIQAVTCIIYWYYVWRVICFVCMPLISVLYNIYLSYWHFDLIFYSTYKICLKHLKYAFKVKRTLLKWMCKQYPIRN